MLYFTTILSSHFYSIFVIQHIYLCGHRNDIQDTLNFTLTKDFSATDSKIATSIVDIVMSYNENLRSAMIIMWAVAMKSILIYFSSAH